MYSLITSLGTGMYKNGYQKTVYQFSDQVTIETSLFFKAILKSQRYDIQQAIIVGTVTSSWDILAEDLEDTDFWVELKDECGGNGISEKSLSTLQEKLNEYYKMPIVLFAHTQTIENNTIEYIFFIYEKAIECVDETHDVLLDITHGFRSMPIFMYQSLLFKLSHITNRQVEIIYGEYIKEQKISKVRDLSKYWELSQITEAKNLFFKQLDGKLLADKLEDEWQDAARCVRALSNIVDSNFSLQIMNVLSQIRNVLNRANNIPFWANDIRDFLNNFYDKVHTDNYSETLYKYAGFLAERQLFVQAVIALQVSIEVKIISMYDNENSNDFGNYDRWQETYKQQYYDNRRIFNADGNRNRLIALERLRNQIAHGGSRNRGRGMPQAGNTENTFNSEYRNVKEFFRFLDKKC